MDPKWFIIGLGVGLAVMAIIAYIFYRWKAKKFRYEKAEQNEEKTPYVVRYTPKATDPSVREWETVTEKEKQKDLELSELRTKYDDLMRSIGREITIDLSRDESITENINSKCRPSVLQAMYSTLSFQTASVLRKEVPKPDNIPIGFWNPFLARMFCSLFEVSGRAMSDVYSAPSGDFARWLQQPIEQWCLKNDVTLHEAPDNSTSSLPENIKDWMLMSLRQKCDTINTNCIVQTIVEKSLQQADTDLTESRSSDDPDYTLQITQIFLEALLPKSDLKWAKKFCEFVDSVCRLSWMMTLQRPPMQFTTPGIGHPLDERVQNGVPHQSMDFTDINNMVVYYYLEPVLEHGDKILEKGRVFLKYKPVPEFSVVVEHVD